MKSIDARILWTPASGPLGEGRRTKGQVDVVNPAIQRDDDAYAFWDGAGVDKWRKANENERLALMFIHFNTIVVRDKLDPIDVHNAFLKIDEYREAVSPEISHTLNVKPK